MSENNPFMKFWQDMAQNYTKSFDYWKDMSKTSVDFSQLFDPWKPMLQNMEHLTNEMAKAFWENLSETYLKEMDKKAFGSFSDSDQKIMTVLSQMTSSNLATGYQKMITNASQILQENQNPDVIMNFWQTMLTEYFKDIEIIPEQAKKVNLNHIMEIWAKIAQGKMDDEVQKYSKRFIESLKVKLKYGVEYYADPESTKVGLTPKETVWQQGKYKLYHYKPEPEKKLEGVPPVLIVYSLINRPYILDLLPKMSLIEYFIDRKSVV